MLGVFAVVEFALVKGLFTGDGTRLVATWIFVALFLWGIGLTAYVMLNRNALAMILDRDGFTINYYLWYRRCGAPGATSAISARDQTAPCKAPLTRTGRRGGSVCFPTLTVLALTGSFN